MLFSDNFSLNLLFAHFAALFVSSSVTTTMHIILPYFFLFNSCYTSGSFSVLVPVSTFDAVLRPTDHCRRPKPCFLMPFLLQFFLFFFPLLAVHPLICAACHCQNRTTTMETNLYPARPSGLSYTHTQAYHTRPRASHALVVLQTSGWGGG